MWLLGLLGIGVLVVAGALLAWYALNGAPGPHADDEAVSE